MSLDEQNSNGGGKKVHKQTPTSIRGKSSYCSDNENDLCEDDKVQLTTVKCVNEPSDKQVCDLSSSKQQLTNYCITQTDQRPEKNSPPVPIKTYQWEELRREKLKGKYPWTYYKYLDEIEMSTDNLSKIETSRASSENPTIELTTEENVTSVIEAPSTPPAIQPIKEIITPIEHPISTTTTNNRALNEIDAQESVQTSITHIIIPIDHTLEAQLKDDHIYEPIQSPDEIDNDTSKEKSHSTEELDKLNEEYRQQRLQKAPPLTKMLLENQSMSIDEERTYLDKRILKTTSLEEDYNKWSKISDHEYEPINPPISEISKGPPIVQKVESELAHLDDDASSTTSAERKFLRIPLDDELVVPEDGQSEDAAMSTEDIEERHLNATPTTIGSRTDNDVNTSQFDSSGLELLPLQRGNRKRAALATDETDNPPNIGQRLKTSANKLTTKLKRIHKKRPRNGMTQKQTDSKKPKKETSKNDKPSLLERAKKIERPKFTMPKMPERPKIHLPKMPDRPKINLPKMSDISMPKMPDFPKPKMPDFSSLGRTKKAPNDDIRVIKTTTTTSTSDPISEPAPKTKRFDFDFRTYPKILSRKQKPKVTTIESVTTEYTQSSDNTEKPKSSIIPDWVTLPRKNRKKGPVGQRWAHKFKDITFADDTSMKSNQESRENLKADETINKGRSSNDPLVLFIPLRENSKQSTNNIVQNNILFEDEKPQLASEEEDLKHDFDDDVPHSFPLAEATSGESLQPESNLEDRSYESSERGGVIEEINADEFFVREKGLSQDNIDLSLYLSSEIREAFQNPVNALSQMTDQEMVNGYFEYNKNLEDNYAQMRDSPEELRPLTPPIKTLRKKKKTESQNESIEIVPEQIVPDEIIEFQPTASLPPSRPSRSRKSSTVTPDEQSEKYHKPPSRPSRSSKGSKISIESVQEHEDINLPPIRPSRSLSRKNSSSSQKYHSQSPITRHKFNENRPPTIPFRRKRSLRSLNICDHNIADPLIKQDKHKSLQEIYSKNFEESDPPQIPQRRSRSRSTTLRTDRTSQDVFDSLKVKDHTTETIQTITTKSVTPPYAKVEKYKIIEPAQPPPRRKRKKRETQFFTVPRRLKDEHVPQRPIRNYSTLRTPNRHLYQDDKENLRLDDEPYIEIEDDDILTRKLQSGEVIQKMKSRPLPAPPRPPRKTHRDNIKQILQEVHTQYLDTNQLQPEDKTDLTKISNESIVKGTLLLGSNQVNIVTEVSSQIDKEVEDILKSENFPAEVEISTQTDPLPDDFCCEEVIAEPTDRIITPTNRRTISEQISFDLSEVSDQPEAIGQRVGLLEQQSRDRLSESPVEQYDETFIKEHAVRLARSEQSTLISRPAVSDSANTVPTIVPETLQIQKLQVSDLDVDRLTVSELMAQKLLVSEIDGMTLKLQDITSNTGTLTTDEIKLPSNLIDEIVSRIQSLQQEQFSQAPEQVRHIVHLKEESTNTENYDSTPSTSTSTHPTENTLPKNINELNQSVPYPHIYILPSSFYQQSSTSEQKLDSTRTPTFPSRPVDDPGLDDAHPDPSIPNLSAQLLRACHSSFSRTVRQVLLELNSRLNSGDEKQDARTAIIVVVVLIAALLFIGFTTRTEPVHYHHWEYFNPPGDDKPA